MDEIEKIDIPEDNNLEPEQKTEEPIDFLKRIVPPHTKVSREVTDEDVQRVIEEAKVLYNICFSQNGPYNGAIAMAHPQIDDKDPLRFFVTASAELIINPVITRQSDFKVDSVEGCYTYPSLKPLRNVPRSNKIDVEFQTIESDGQLSRIGFKKLSGRESKIWQHEIGHLDAKYIYDEKISVGI